MIEDLQEIKQSIKSVREPSKWQLFLKSCIPDQPKNLGMGEKVTACSTIYKDIKNEEQKPSLLRIAGYFALLGLSAYAFAKISKAIGDEIDKYQK